MRRGQKSQSRVRHQRSVGRYHSPYQRGGTIFRTRNPWGFTSYKPCEIDPMVLVPLDKEQLSERNKEG